MNKDFEILDKDIKDEEIDWLYWGGKKFKITKEDIEALLNGQKIYASVNNEYAFTIELKKEVEKMNENE